jgi:hypothetical protein
MLKNPFSQILIFFGSILIFSCVDRPSNDLHLGSLDELIFGELTIQKDSLTKNIEVKGVVSHQQEEFLVSLADRERTIQYYSLQTGGKVREIKLPDDGPNSFLGYVGYLIAEGMDSLTIINWDGWFYEYNEGQRIKVERIDPQLDFPNSFYNSIYYGRGTNFNKVSESHFQISVSPLLRPASNFSGKTKMFDKIEEWIVIFDSKRKYNRCSKYNISIWV